MDLSTAADIAQVLGLTTIVGGGAIAFVQLRNAHFQRAEQAAIEMVRTLQTPELVDEMLLILNHPSPTVATIRSDPKLASAALHVLFTSEILGCMVFERVVRLPVLDRMWGGFLRGSWQRLEPFVHEERQRTGFVNYGEWFEWLNAQLVAHPEKSKSVGAQVAYRDWKP